MLCSLLSEVSEGTFLFDRNPISQDEFSTGEARACCTEGQTCGAGRACWAATASLAGVSLRIRGQLLWPSARSVPTGL